MYKETKQLNVLIEGGIMRNLLRGMGCIALFFGSTLSFVAKADPVGGVPANLKWLEQTTFTGDVRYRQDWSKEDQNGAKRDGRYRQRLRVRLGFHAELDEGWGLGARLSTMDAATTNGGSPDSYNQTLERNASKKLVGWDLAYIQWKNNSGWLARGGKMLNALYIPHFSQLLFDQDYTPEGLVLQTPWLTTVGYILDERGLTQGSNTKMDPTAWLWATQAKKDFALTNDMNVTAGAGYYHFFNIQGYTNLYTTNNNFPFLGNTYVADGAINKYANPYQVVQLFGEFQPTKAMPLSFYADVIQNVAIAKGNFGWIAGTKYGNLAKAKSWDLMYSFRRTDADATVSALNDSDMAASRELSYGHIIAGRYGYTDRVRLAVYYNTSMIGAAFSDHYDRVFFDVNVSL